MLLSPYTNWTPRRIPKSDAGTTSNLRRLKITSANGFCGHNLRPPIEEAIKRLCNQFW